MTMEYGLQLFSVRDIAAEDLREALRRVAELGYRYVEFAGFFDHPAADVKAWLDEYDLIVSGTHTGMAGLTAEVIDETIAYHLEIGCRDIIVPGAKWGTEEDMEANIVLLNEAQKKLAAAGIRLSYHNHSPEFYPTPYGKYIEEELIARTDISFELDTFWLFNAGLDPVAYCEAHKDRVSFIHLKDGILPKETRDFATANQNVIGRSLGQGEAPVEAVREWAIKNNIRMVVESEGLQPTGIDEVGRCIDYLNSLEA